MSGLKSYQLPSLSATDPIADANLALRMGVISIQLHFHLQSVVGRCGGKLPPFCRPWILVIFVACVVAPIAIFRVVAIAANLSITCQLITNL